MNGWSHPVFAHAAGILALLSPGELGFEGLPPGTVDSLSTDLGVWSGLAGTVLIDPGHARTGEQCLQLGGGAGQAASTALLRFNSPLEAEARFSFWAERWTRRDPFHFTVEARGGEGWREIHDGTNLIKVGGFDTHVEAALKTGDTALRLRCEAPEGTGILLDDVSISLAKPMQLTSVTVAQPTLPVLVGNRINPVLHLQVVTEGSLDPLVLSEVQFDMNGTTKLQDFESIQLVLGKGGSAPAANSRDQLYGELPTGQMPASARMLIASELVLRPGTNHLWISVVPGVSADIDGFVDAHVHSIQLSGRNNPVPVSESKTINRRRQRMGIALRNAGDSGSAAYRIPGLVTTPAGTLIGVYDVRWKGWGDLPGDIDVGLSRSSDDGRTWGPMQVVMDMGHDAEWRHDGVGDPAVLVDHETGRIFVMATWSHGDRSWRGSGPGLTPEETGQLMLVHSDDEGATWSSTRNLTEDLKRPEWSFLLQGPGRGITMSDGTLVFPAQFQLSQDEGRMPHSTVISSTDHGETWQVGTGILSNTTESAVVELGDGLLMSNQRNNRGGLRSVYTSNDLGTTWKEHASSRSTLRGPVCMASLIHVGRELAGASDGLLLFSNPDVARAPRRRMTIKASPDLGATWPSESTLLLDEERSAGYSCLTMVDGKTVGILYEGSRAHMTFQRVPLADILAGD